MKDLVYIFDKLSPYSKQELGEIQSDFNMSFTIDGNKDSTKLVIRSFSGDEVEPYTILYHANTQTWWCVIQDKVQRNANEDGFIYIHTLTLNGAKELLNARDLTDCGFNDKTYTIAQFLERLIKLSKWDFPNIEFIYGNNIAFYQNVSFIKTFENYTIYSALREFLDAYNCDFKLTFTIQSNKLNKAQITIIPKTGNVDLTILEDSAFKDIREIKKIDKNSFGTTVISNCENVISSFTKTYPSKGTTKLSSTEYTINGSTAVFRLPSKVYKANWLRLNFKYSLSILFDNGITSRAIVVYVGNDNSVESVKTKFHDIIDEQSFSQSLKDDIIEQFDSQWTTIRENIIKLGTITFYEGNSLDPITAKIVKGANVPYIPKINFSIGSASDTPAEVIFTDKSLRECLPTKEQGIYWERGSDLIKGFDFINYVGDDNSFLVYIENTEYQNNNQELFATDGLSRSVKIRVNSSFPVKIWETNWVINYIPMGDIKIELDNQRSTKDIQLYNQNGRLTDNYALSKLLNSYSREISSDNITKYMDYYNFFACPKAGQLVKYNNELYVINNISFDFYLNDSSGYYINAEINMCKYVSTKSLMVNPNTNIRDYGIPQNYNVKRKQLYRDYLEFSYTQDNNATGSFYNSNILLSFDINGFTQNTHTVAIECKYSNAIGGNNDDVSASEYWYYQLETTLYLLDKSYIELLDFKDNNIIGYGSFNTHSAFQIDKIFDGFAITINTPISYVDENGNVESISLRFATVEQLEIAWNTYQGSTAYSNNTDYDISNMSVIIPYDVYNNLENGCDIEINETTYKKDAIEVPVFEYMFQVGDSDEVVIGDKILDNKVNVDFGNHAIFWFYGFVEANAGTLNQNNALLNARDITMSGVYPVLNNAVMLNDEEDELDVYLYNYSTFISGMSYGTNKNPNANKDYAIYRIEWNNTMDTELQRQLVMVLKNVPSSAIASSGGESYIRLYKNKYKLK